MGGAAQFSLPASENKKGDVAKFDFCRISTSPFSYSFFWLSRLAAIFFAS